MRLLGNDAEDLLVSYSDNTKILSGVAFIGKPLYSYSKFFG